MEFFFSINQLISVSQVSSVTFIIPSSLWNNRLREHKSTYASCRLFKGHNINEKSMDTVKRPASTKQECAVQNIT